MENTTIFLRLFAKLRKANAGYVASVCPSVYLFVRMKQLSSHWRDFYEILYWTIFRKSVKKIQISLKYQKKNGHYTWTSMSIYDNMSLISPYIEKWFRQKF